MAETASERIRIDAPREACLAVVLDFERYPEWARDVKQVTVLETDDEGRGEKVEFRAAGLGKSFRYTLAYDFSELPAAFSWSLVEGEGLRRLDGSYRFEPEDDSHARALRPRGRHRDPAAGPDQAPRRGNDHGHRAEGAEEGGRGPVGLSSGVRPGP